MADDPTVTQVVSSHSEPLVPQPTILPFLCLMPQSFPYKSPLYALSSLRELGPLPSLAHHQRFPTKRAFIHWFIILDTTQYTFVPNDTAARQDRCGFCIATSGVARIVKGAKLGLAVGGRKAGEDFFGARHFVVWGRVGRQE